MALNPNDPRYLAEVVPPSITAMAGPLCDAYGVGRDAFGDKGNVYHTYGYHRSRRWILNSPDSRYGSRDYSVQVAVDRQGDEDHVSAFDFTPGDWGTRDNRQKMIMLTKRMRAAARAYDPRLRDLREIAGTEDGVNVVTFKAQGGADLDPFDSSHLDHLHGSFWRDSAAHDHSGIVDVMLGHQEEDEDMPYANITIPARGQRASVSLPGGNANRAPVTWICATNDTAGQAYGLRIFISNGKGWYPAGGGSGLFKATNGATLSVACPGIDDPNWAGGVRGVSVMRAPLDAHGAVTDPGAADLGDAVWYDGALTFCVEQQR